MRIGCADRRPRMINLITALWALALGASALAPVPAWAAVQLRVDPVVAMDADVGVQAARVRVGGLAAGQSVEVIGQTPSAEYALFTRADKAGYVSLDMPMPPGDAVSGSGRSSVAVLSGSRVVAASRLPEIIEPNADLMLVLGPNADTLTYLTSTNHRSADSLAGRIVSAEELPERWFGYGPVTAVVADADTLSTLDRSRRRALIDWLESGGLLVSYPGLTGALPKPADLLALAPLSARHGKQTMAPLAALARAVGGRARLAPQLAWPAAAAPGSRVIGPRGRPLAAVAQTGLGAWVALTVDPTQDELEVSPYRRAVFDWVVGWATPGRTRPPSAIAQRVSPESTPLGRMPNGWLLALIGLAYVALVGPANFFILGRLDRRDLAWATVPVISGLFTAAMFGAGLTSRDGPLRAYQTEWIVWGRAATSGVAHSTVSLFSPRSARYSVQMPGDWVPLAPTGDPRFEQGPLFKARLSGSEADIRDLLIPRWSIRRVTATGIVHARAPVEVELSVSRGRATGNVRNVSDIAADMWLVETDRGLVLPLGTFAPNQYRQVDVRGSDAEAAPDGKGPWARRATGAMMTSSALRDLAAGGLALVAVPETPEAPAEVKLAKQTVSVLWAIPLVDKSGTPLMLAKPASDGAGMTGANGSGTP
jgi:hypothetical protein